MSRWSESGRRTKMRDIFRATGLLLIIPLIYVPDVLAIVIPFIALLIGIKMGLR